MLTDVLLSLKSSNVPSSICGLTFYRSRLIRFELLPTSNRERILLKKTFPSIQLFLKYRFLSPERSGPDRSWQHLVDFAILGVAGPLNTTRTNSIFVESIKKKSRRAYLYIVCVNSWQLLRPHPPPPLPAICCQIWKMIAAAPNPSAETYLK